MKRRNYLICIILLATLLGLAVAQLIYLTKHPVKVTETVVEHRTDTLKFWYPVTKYVTLKDFEFFEFPRDSIIETYKRDTVAVPIPIEQRTYTDDSTYLCKISGYHPTLDYIETYQKTTTITNTIIKRPIISIGPAISVGYDPWRKQFSNSIGVSIIIPVYSIYR